MVDSVPIDYLLNSTIISNIPYATLTKDNKHRQTQHYRPLKIEDQYQQLINVLILPNGYKKAQELVTSGCYQLQFNKKTDLNHDYHLSNLLLICSSYQPENVMFAFQHSAPISSNLVLQFVQQFTSTLTTLTSMKKIKAFWQIFKLLVINLKVNDTTHTNENQKVHHDLLLLLSSLGCFRAIQFLCEHQPVFYELFLENLKLYIPVLKPFMGYINLQYHVWWKDVFLFSLS
jgi:hypothetical protein